MLGDGAFETRASAVFHDPLARLAYEIQLQVDPDDDDAKANLAYLHAR